MFTVPTDGGMFWSRWRCAIRKGRCGCIFVACRLRPPEPPNISPRRLLYFRLKANAAEALPIAYATCRSPGAPFPRQLQLSGRIVDQEAPCPCQSGVRFPGEWFLASVASSLICRGLPRVVAFYRSPWHGGAAFKRWPPSTGPVCHLASSGNAVRLRHALAYNLGNFMRILALPKEVEHWSTTLRDKLVDRGQGCPTWRLRYVPIG